jgi:sugar lactone lactonase YvrE
MSRPVRIAIAAVLGLLFLVGGYLARWPVPVDPIAWEAPPAPPAEGDWAPNEALAQVTRLPVPAGDHGPEDLHAWGGGVVGGTHGGRIVRWPSEGGAPTMLAETGGRPLGLHPLPDGRLAIADATRGLLALSPDGALETLCATDAEGRPLATDGSRIVFTDDVDVAPDGTAWFSDASAVHPQPVWKRDILESRPHGRLLRWRPGEGCAVVLDGLFFANGVAVSLDGTFLLLNETSRYRVRRIDLSGPTLDRGTVLVDNLPGFPDGIAAAGDGTFWIALASPRNAVVDTLAPYPGWRKVLLRLPDALQPAPERHPHVVQIDADGRVLRTLQDPSGRSYGMVTSVQPDGDRLLLGSLAEPAGALVALADAR